MQYISSSLKLLQHTDRLHAFQNGMAMPITIECAPTDVCQLECSYCSVINRPANVLDYDLLMRTMLKFYGLGAKAVVLTGGGDPTLYPRISDAVAGIKEYGMQVGMITNGLKLERVKSIDCLTWLRISLNLDQERGSKLAVPDIPSHIVLGFSLVISDNDLNILDQAIDFISRQKRYDYLRVVGNCIGDIEERKEIAENVSKYVERLGNPKVFFSYKLPEAPKGCYLGYFKPFLYADGYIYPCSSCVLGEQRFPEKFRVCHANNISELYHKGINSFVEPTCSFCVLTEQNNFIASFMNKMEHANFV